MSVTLLREVILPNAFNKNGSKFVECELDSDSSGQDQFQSTVVFLTATVETDFVVNKIPLIIKFRPSSELLKSEFKTHFQFNNEVLMYSKLIPLLDINSICSDIFPKFYYGVSSVDETQKDVILVEDLRPKGYRLSSERFFLDYQHLKLGMEKLGKFHALSYAAKKRSPEKFHGFVENLKEIWWNEDSARMMAMVKADLHRAVDPLIAQGKHVQKLSQLMSRIDENIVSFFRELLTPKEPVAVLCHGDFCRNNMLFKYNQGRPVDVKFFDLAGSRYSSPAVDITLFLLLNSTRDMRTAHWNDLLASYYGSLSTAVPGIEIPSLEDIQEEIRKIAIHGLSHIVHFLPLILYMKDINLEVLMTNTSPEDAAKISSSLGEKDGDKLLTDLAGELFDRFY